MTFTKFWTWFLHGSNPEDKSGIQRIFSRWSPVHITVGATLSWLLPFISIQEAAQHLLLPAILLVLVSQSPGSMLKLMQNPEMRGMAKHAAGKIPMYIWTHQLCILILTFTGVLIALGALGIFHISHEWGHRISLGAFFAQMSFAAQVCWEKSQMNAYILYVSTHLQEHDERVREEAT